MLSSPSFRLSEDDNEFGSSQSDADAVASRSSDKVRDMTWCVVPQGTVIRCGAGRCFSIPFWEVLPTFSRRVLCTWVMRGVAQIWMFLKMVFGVFVMSTRSERSVIKVQWFASRCSDAHQGTVNGRKRSGVEVHRCASSQTVADAVVSRSSGMYQG